MRIAPRNTGIVNGKMRKEPCCVPLPIAKQKMVRMPASTR